MKIEHFLRPIAVVGALTLWGGSARADQPSILLQLSVDPALLDEQALRETIQRELERPVVSVQEAEHVGELSIKSLPGSRVSVTYRRTHDQEPLVRVVSLPRVREERAQWIAWLVGNLARDEATDWLSQHHGDDSLRVQPGAVSARADSVPENGSNSDASNSALPPPVPTALQVPAPAPARPVRRGPGLFREGATTLESRTFNLSLWYKWLQLHPGSSSMRFALQLGAGYGRVGAIRGFGFDLLHHRVEQQVQGMAGSLIWTWVPRTHGLAWSTGVVTADGRLRGADLAWIFAYRNAAVPHGELQNGATFAPGSNPDVIGVQLAGVGAWNRGTFVGVQGASAFTRHQGSLRGFQMSFGANVADRAEGAQLAAVNVADDVRGVQFGLVNYARRVDGIAIGLVNIASNVRVQALPWVERDYHANLGLRYVYRPLTFGYSISRDPQRERTRILFGIGARLQRDRFAIAPAVNVGFFFDKRSGDTSANSGHENDVRISFEWEALPRRLGLLAGPALAMQSDPEGGWRIIPRWFVGLSVF